MSQAGAAPGAVEAGSRPDLRPGDLSEPGAGVVSASMPGSGSGSGSDGGTDVGGETNAEAGDDMTNELGISPRLTGAKGALADHVIYINWDGFAYDYYAWANGRSGPGTPVLNFLASRGALFTSARNGFPSITNPMQTSIVTGAWPAVHGNTYRYYDPVENLVKQTGRDNAAETIAEAVERSGLSCASVQQFTLDGRGTYPSDPSHLYIQPGGPWRRRLAEAVKILRRETVVSQDGPVTVPEVPRFLAIYADDL
ncbi:MAG: alkaline phosphatase family protein, partial [Thermodesulfobacteriota bacterium]